MPRETAGRGLGLFQDRLCRTFGGDGVLAEEDAVADEGESGAAAYLNGPSDSIAQHLLTSYWECVVSRLPTTHRSCELAPASPARSIRRGRISVAKDQIPALNWALLLEKDAYNPFCKRHPHYILCVASLPWAY